MNDLDEIPSYHVMIAPVCLTCGEDIEFLGEGGSHSGVAVLVVGRCKCERERVMTVRSFELMEAFGDPISQTIVVENIVFSNEWPKDREGKMIVDVVVARYVLDAIVRREFPDAEETDRAVLIEKLRRLKLVMDT